MADFAARVNNVMRNYRHSEEVWFEHMTNWMDTYYSNPAGFENIWKAQAAQHNLTTADLTTFKNNVKTRHKPAYTMAKNSHELSPHTKPLMLEHVVDQLPLETEDDKKLAARAAQALMPILDVPFSMRSRDGWGALHCDELQTAISEARIGKGVQPPVIKARYDVVAGGVGRGLAPTYNPPGADIEYAVAIQSYMVHLGKDPKTGVMSSARCKAVRQLVELAIQDAKNDRTVADAAVSMQQLAIHFQQVYAAGGGGL